MAATRKVSQPFTQLIGQRAGQTYRVVRRTPTSTPQRMYNPLTAGGKSQYATIKPPAAPFTPTPSGAAGIGTNVAAPPAAPADPRDATYFNDEAKLNQFYGTKSADLTAGKNDLTRNFQSANRDLDIQQPKDVLSAKQNANKAGLFYSGALGKNLGQIETSYANRRADLQGTYNSGVASIDRQIGDLNANYGPTGLLRNDSLLNAVSRATDRDQTSGILDALNPANNKPARTKAIVSIGRPTKTVRGKTFYQRASDNKWIPFS